MISDYELKKLAGAGSIGPCNIRTWATIFSMLLERQVTTDEAWNAIDRLNQRNEPPAPGTTLGDVERSSTTELGGLRSLFIGSGQ